LASVGSSSSSSSSVVTFEKDTRSLPRYLDRFTTYSERA
jgi:hypothetical protein